MKYSKEIFYQEFIRREDSTNRAPYNPELEFYSIIQNGDIEQVKELCKKPHHLRIKKDSAYYLKSRSTT